MRHQKDSIEICNQDSLEVMAEIPDKYYDLCLTDPPYGIGIDKMNYVNDPSGVAKNTDYRGKADWDIRPGLEYFKEIFRISKNQIIFGGNYFADILPIKSCWIVWDKKTADKYNNDFGDGELAWTSYDKPLKIYRWLYSGMLQQNAKVKDKRYHPAQKATGLIKRILQDFTKEGDLVIDPFLGSGTTTRACKDLNRKCLGIEISVEFYEIAIKRIAQGVLF